MWGVTSGSRSSSRSIFVLYLFRSTPSLAPVPSVSPYIMWGSTPDLDPAPDPCLGSNLLTLITGPLHLWLQSYLCFTLDHVRGQLQIHIWVVIFDLNFHCIILTLWYLQNSIFCPITLFHVVRFEKLFHKQVLFRDNCFEYQPPYVIFFVPKLCSKLSDLKNSFTNRGHFWGNHFEYQQSYVIFKIEHLIPYFCLFQYYFLHIYISHFFIFQVQFWQPQMTFWN